MKTAFVKGPALVEISDTVKPVLGSGDILVKMQSCGICG
ncbi:MAG: L-iditol 2-dehydrogenase, partial [Nitrosopumilaceae archaeon]|nr:L-iditol 2-dehydrogenase [Nitrosopumilaceae archaeon]